MEKEINAERIKNVLIKNPYQELSISDLVKKMKISRSSIRTTLAKLEGANKIGFRKVGMAKLYSWKENEN